MSNETPTLNPMEERAVRLEKLQAAYAAGINPYPAKVEPTVTVQGIHERFDELSASGESVTVVGRLRSVRGHGGACFADLEDGGHKIQLHLKSDALGAGKYEGFERLVDRGDFLQASGPLFVTRRGERSVEVRDWRLAGKALRPLPTDWYGLSDVETRYRKRYLDLLANPVVRGVFQKRSIIVQTIREFLHAEGFMEVETPILQPLAGGASARPFVTHHNALDIDLYLRVAPELYLKRLVAGGLGRVFEMARCFRNEGIDHLHNPEFTQVEFYQAYADYEDLMRLTERLLPRIVERLQGPGNLVVEYEGLQLDFTPPYPRVTFADALRTIGDFDLAAYPDRESLAAAAKARGIEVAGGDGTGTILDNVYKKLVRAKIVDPTFVIDYPTAILPLAKKKPGAPQFTESFQLLAARGFELLKAFSELNDPLDQRARFEEQERLAAAGDEEAQRIDEDFLEMMEVGMPPMAGFGMGIDRLTALLTNSHSLKEVILFPTMRPDERG
jgi:lysyl-tRNA synthetase class 2